QRSDLWILSRGVVDDDKAHRFAGGRGEIREHLEQSLVEDPERTHVSIDRGEDPGVQDSLAVPSLRRTRRRALTLQQLVVTEFGDRLKAAVHVPDEAIVGYFTS